MQPNKALQLTPSRNASLFTTAFPLPPTFHQLSGFIGVAELGVRLFNIMRKKKLWETFLALATLGVIAIIWIAAIEIILLFISVIIGIAIAAFKGWGVGLIVGILAYAIINKILWFFDIFDMITSGRSKKAEQGAAANP
jgi:hypothetical protein